MVDSAADKYERIQKAADLIKTSAYCVALTGAGISTPSGIPDFRSPGSGIWNQYSPMEVASLSAFRYHPNRFYDWLRPFIKNLVLANPNSAHTALAELEKHHYLSSVITQNIDGLHQKSGSEHVIEVHGSFRTLTCSACFTRIGTTDQLIQGLIADNKVPRCEKCGKILKPDIILYQEQLPAETWKKALDQAMACDLMLILGSSLTVTPTCDLPYTALGKGAALIILNRTATHLDDHAAVSIQGDLETLLPAILKQVLDEKK